MKKIGLIGLGLMGSPMAENWMKKDFELTVLAHKNTERAQALVKKGAHLATNSKELVEKSDVIALMLPTSAEVEKITLEIAPRLTPEKLVVDFSTSDPDSTRSIASRYAQEKLRFFDSPVTGGVKGAVAGTLTLFVGGEKAWFDESLSVLKAVSTTQKHFGPVGSGHVAKIINNFISVVNMAVLGEALPLAAAAGLKADTLFETLVSGSAGSRMLSDFGSLAMEGDFDPRFKLTHAYKDIRLAKKLAQKYEVDLPVLDGALKDFEAAHQKNLDEKNMSAVMLVFEEKFKAEFRA